MTGSVLVLNAGSSSLKFCLFRRDTAGAVRRDLDGQIAGLGTAPRLEVHDEAGTIVERRPLEAAAHPDARAAMGTLAAVLGEHRRNVPIAAVGHRVVHGGTAFAAPVRVQAGILEALRALVPLAPLHQPFNIAGIEAVFERLPGVPQVACFDTAFHRGHPPVADLVPVPWDLYDSGVRRYGFHGLSYESIASALPGIAPEIARGRAIVAHLGSGASLCALREGQSVDCTFGFTPLDGLCMGTRPGALDPGVVLHLFQAHGLNANEVEDILYRRSGLLGISGLSNDMRALLASDAPRARLAVEYFVYRVTKEIGALAAVLGGLDGIVFTAGIGENSPAIRARVCAAAAWLGVQLDPVANERGGPCISSPRSAVPVWVIPTDEESVIARHTLQLLGAAR